MQVRKPHKLKSNKRTYVPTQFIFFDTETYQVKRYKYKQVHKLKLGWSCYWRRSTKATPEVIKWKEFKRKAKFWDFVESNVRVKTRLVLIAHNIVFDFTICGGWDQLIHRGWKLIRLYEKNHIFIAKYKKGSKSILLLDNMNFFAVPLWKLGKQIGYEKLEVDFSNCTNDELSVYCKRDTEILLKAWQKYFAWFMKNDLGNFGVTISSQSFNTFRHKFMKEDIFIHNRKYVLDFERESYFGGRTECFKLGKFTTDNYYCLDINSMYPYAMKDNFYPIKYMNYKKNVSPTILKYYLKKYCVIARVKIKTSKPIFPKRKVIFNKDHTYKQVDREWDLMQKDFNQLKISAINLDFKGLSPKKAIRKWTGEKGGLKGEYVTSEGKKKLREEYQEVPKYLLKRSGFGADELAQDLSEEYPDLASMFNIDNLHSWNGDNLISALKGRLRFNNDFPAEDFVEGRLSELYRDQVEKYRFTGKVIFPVGSFEAVLTTGELELALSENVVQEVLSVTLYEKAKIFSDFIDFFYTERLEAKKKGNTAYDVFYKLIMNSLYGKFGQLMGEWTTVGRCNPEEVDYWHEVVRSESKIYKYRKINGLVQRYEDRREAFNSFPAISSHVTAYSRVKLWKLMEKAGRKNVYYCDTDSLFTNQEGYQNLKSELDQKELGKLKVEDITKDLQLFGCKNYIFGDRVKHKGKKKDAVKIDKNTYRQSQWATLKSLIQNKDLASYEVKSIIKHFTGKYDKGTVDMKGNIRPLIL